MVGTEINPCFADASNGPAYHRNEILGEPSEGDELTDRVAEIDLPAIEGDVQLVPRYLHRGLPHGFEF